MWWNMHCNQCLYIWHVREFVDGAKCPKCQSDDISEE